jgi:hypothetical protein
MHRALKDGLTITLHAVSSMLLLLPLVWFAGGFNRLTLNPQNPETGDDVSNTILANIS